MNITKTNQELKKLKQELANYLKDKTIPLEERWNVFLKADEGLSEHGRYVEHFTFDGHYAFEERLYRGSGRMRGDFTAEDVVESLGYYLNPYVNGEQLKEIDQIDPNIEPQLKEHFLQKNLKSFLFNW